MCGSKPRVDNTYQIQMQKDAEEARRKEEERQARIKDGSASIDQSFSQFDDGFFDTFRQNFMNYYQPQLDNKFVDANDQLTFALARSGTLNSTAAADKRGDLRMAYDDARASILSDANAQTDGLRGQIAKEKSGLLAQLNATGDSQRAASEATARSTNLFKTQPSYNPLGDIFAGITSGYAAAKHGQRQQEIWDTYTGKAPSKSSSRIVG